MFVKRIKTVFAVMLAAFVLAGCKNEISKSDMSYGYITVNESNYRQVLTSEIASAVVTVRGYDKNGSAFEKKSGAVEAVNGGASNIVIEKIPVCKNAVVTVQGYTDAVALNEAKGMRMAAICDIKAEGTSVNVTWDSSKTGFVYAALIDKGVNTNTLEDDDISSINSAIPAGTDVHASLINAAQIASDYVSGSLGSSDSYKLTCGSVNITCKDYDGYTLQITDPLSSTVTASTSSPVSITGVAPGTWTLYVLEGDTVKDKKTVTITSGGSINVEIGQVVITDKIIVHAKWYKGIYIYGTTGITTNSYDMTSEGNDWYTYTLNVTSAKLIFKTEKDSWDGQTGNLTRTAGEWWFIGDSGSMPTGTWYDHNPEVPVAPTVSISPATGKVALNDSISVAFDDGNDAIISAKVTVNGTEYNMGTTAGTWSKKLSELGITSEGVTVTVSASVTNSVGTGTASASLTTKAASKLVTNPNELRIYQVMVASFQDGDPSIGYTDMWGPSGALKGGDLRGIINALDYIKGLGCNALWMTPIFTSNGSADYKLNATGYFAGNYFEIDPNFGTIDTFEELVNKCHEKGIAVILDGVFGHTSAAKGGYVVPSPKGKTPTGKDPVNYTDTNTQDFFKEVAEYWIKNYKIDGWRLDQCYQVSLGENATGSDKCNTGGHNYWYDIRKVVEQAAASNGTKGTDWGTLGYMVGEHWRGDATLIQNGSVVSGTAAGYGLNSCFDFPAYYQLVQGFACEYGQSSKTTDNITTGLSYLYKTYTEKGYSCKEDDGTYETYYPNCMLTNHDLYRIGDVIKGKWGCGYDSDEYIGRNKVILAAQCAYSGPITIYYGDEIGDHSVDLSGWGSDNVARSSGKITGFNSREQAIHDWTQKCLEARADHEALWNGTNTQITGDSDFYVAKKQGGGETIYIAFNYNKSSSKNFSASGTDLLSGKTYNGTVTVPALSAVYVLAK